MQVALFARDRLVVTEAARAGAREASVSSSSDDVREAVERAADGLRKSEIDVEIDRGGGQGDPVTVTVTYTDVTTVPFVSWLVPQSIELRAAATMRQEYV